MVSKEVQSALFQKNHWFSMSISLALSWLVCFSLGSTQCPLQAHSWDKDSKTELCRIFSPSGWEGQPHAVVLGSGKNSPSLLIYPTLLLKRHDSRFGCPAGSGTWVAEQKSGFEVLRRWKGSRLPVYILGTECGGFALSVWPLNGLRTLPSLVLTCPYLKETTILFGI